MTKPTAAIIQFQKKQETEFLCSACGADRGCNCNAPAVERLAEIREKARQEKRRQREKSKENNTPVRQTIDTDAAPDTGPIEEACTDCINDEERWQRSLSNMAGDAISLPFYWSREFGQWDQFGCPRELAKLATQAAEAWKQIASELNQRIK